MTSIWTPWGCMPLQRDQAAPGAEFGDLSSAAFVIPFHPFDITPLRGDAAVSDTHRDSEKEQSWVTRDGSNLTLYRAIAT